MTAATRRRAPVDPSRLTPLDRAILDEVCWLRVVRQDQLGRLHPEVPERTLRYRTRRLTQLRLLGRTRPYRERGSAPHHFWPTRHADALMRGEPLPRGGERRAPNPLFLAHAAAITELYVTLRTSPPSGFTLTKLFREGEAREPFTDAAGQERAIAPDATIVLADSDGVELCAFVELDRGSMSSGRLRTKARGYAEFYAANGWRERFSYCPPLLFLTTTAARARTFRSLLRRTLKDVHPPSGDPFVAAVCAEVFSLGRAFGKPVWTTLDGEAEASVVELMRAARRPYDELRAAWRAEDEAFAALLNDPRAVHERLASESRANLRYDFGETAGGALELLLARTELTPSELTVVGELAGSVEGRSTYPRLRSNADVRRSLGRLAGEYVAQQLVALDRLADRHGDGPHLRAARRTLDGRQVPFSEVELRETDRQAKHDEKVRAEQEALRAAYPALREERARKIVKARGLSARLRGTEPVLPEVDAKLLCRCTQCEETLYPDPARPRNDYSRCPYCGGHLSAWSER